MSTQYARAPHFRGDPIGAHAPNAALLIDFDNVTMGMRSDLSKDLKKLLQSDVIRGKVTVQRAYADWRRYPQYIVPLSENSIDLIFAPAYGSSKKNATDIRMAIDAVELVFTRPEIGTYILLTGDSDFSSCVLKLKEYGKYVIGVGIQESSSDILVQNCDEYYSYTSLAGLQKTTEAAQRTMDPWVLVEKAVKKMAERNDVMRSDRLKQVMLEMDSSFDESSFGFSKFSKFVTEAAHKDLITLRKLDNGQYEVLPAGGGGDASAATGRSRDDRGGRGRGRGRKERGGGNGRSEPQAVEAAEAPPEPTQAAEDSGGGRGADLAGAYDTLRDALDQLKEDGRHPVRDSDVKRKLLEIQSDWDEATLGFAKFSHFLKKAHDDEVVDLAKQDGGGYEVSLRAVGGTAGTSGRSGRSRAGKDEAASSGAVEAAAAAAAEAPDGTSDGTSGQEPASETVQEIRPEDVVSSDTGGRRLGPRGGMTRRRSGDDDTPPPLFEGQGRQAASSGGSPNGASDQGDEHPTDLSSLDLPTEPRRIVRYLTRYKGVGEKTAQQVVDRFGDQVFHTMDSDPGALEGVVPAGRVEQLLAGWKDDLERRSGGGDSKGKENRSRSRGGRRGGSRRGRRSSSRGGSSNES